MTPDLRDLQRAGNVQVLNGMAKKEEEVYIHFCFFTGQIDEHFCFSLLTASKHEVQAFVRVFFSGSCV